MIGGRERENQLPIKTLASVFIFSRNINDPLGCWLTGASPRCTSQLPLLYISLQVLVWLFFVPFLYVSFFYSAISQWNRIPPKCSWKEKQKIRKQMTVIMANNRRPSKKEKPKEDEEEENQMNGKQTSDYIQTTNQPASSPFYFCLFFYSLTSQTTCCNVYSCSFLLKFLYYVLRWPCTVLWTFGLKSKLFKEFVLCVQTHTQDSSSGAFTKRQKKKKQKKKNGSTGLPSARFHFTVVLKGEEISFLPTTKFMRKSQKWKQEICVCLFVCFIGDEVKREREREKEGK